MQILDMFLEISECVETSRFVEEIDPERMEIDKSIRSSVFDLTDDPKSTRQKWSLSKPKFTQEQIQNFIPSASDLIQTGMTCNSSKIRKRKSFDN